VNYGASGTAVTAVGNTGYHFVNWSDGSTSNPRTDTNVMANVSVTASFAINTYTLTYTAGANGSISGTSPQSVNYGASGTAVTAVGNTGYHFVNWSDGSTANPRTDTNVMANVSVTASFTKNIYTITASASPPVAGTVNGAGAYAYQELVILTATANSGYFFSNWTENGNFVSAANPYSFSATANRNLVANFLPVPSQVTIDGTKCSDFGSGTAQGLSVINYSVGNNGKTKDTKDAKFFYWVKVTVPAGNNQTFVINQAITTGNFSTQFKLDGGSNVFRASDCKAAGGLNFTQNTTSGASSTVTAKFNAATAGVYYIAVKFQTGNLNDKVAPNPAAVHYQFSTPGIAGSTSAVDYLKR
jgi:hypothetical protein